MAGLLIAPGASFAQDAEGDGSSARALNESKALAVVANAIEGAIRPGYAALEEAARKQVASVEALCATPGEDKLLEARDGFEEQVSAYAGIEFVRFGPIREDNRLERLVFFPDPRGVTRRQVEELLAEEDESASTAESLAQKSVAVQGLPALEFVLFGEGSDTLATADAAYRCSYGEAIAQNVASIAGEITEAWAEDDGIYKRLTAPKADDPAYRNASDSIGEIISVFTEGLKIIRDQRIRPALGEEGTPPKAYLFLFNRSGNALAALQADFAGLSTMFEAASFTEVLPKDEAFLQNSISFEFQEARATLDDAEGPLSDTVADEDVRGKLDYAMIVAGSLRSQFENQLAASLGLSTGFSSLDGD
ncbi:hypothetical protein FP2506_16454 [Fulvimarina pelagi HTCC2506]|uniref:Imelysin-like domain-containing protein n=2 Tax=Fulvimarina pelagi TaxID=217511 RepID=Q0G2Y9_9HYPH|nr:hypothetical protein FP2506_16454 [Fulvimarina pelagi HTCC2506]